MRASNVLATCFLEHVANLVAVTNFRCRMPESKKYIINCPNKKKLYRSNKGKQMLLKNLRDAKQSQKVVGNRHHMNSLLPLDATNEPDNPEFFFSFLLYTLVKEKVPIS